MLTPNPKLYGKKVLIVIARLNKGGTAQYLEELTNGLLRAGIEVLIATGYVQGGEVEAECANYLPIRRIANLGRKIDPIRDFRARRELQKVVDEFNPDLIYTHTFKAGLIGRTLTRHPPVIHAFHGHLLSEPEFQGWRLKILIQIERYLAPRAVKIMTVGVKVAEELMAVGVGRPDQFQSIAPGVKPIELEDRNQVRMELGIAGESRPIVTWLARVTAVKAPHRVIELAKRFPEAIFLQAGGGDLLEQMKGEPPLENWRLLGWQSAARIWAATDIAISTSENEGMPIALIEAQLAGIPVVALDVGSVAEVIESGKTGYVVKRWGREFEDRLGELIAAPELRSQFAAAAIKRARFEFDPARMLELHYELLVEALGA